MDSKMRALVVDQLLSAAQKCVEGAHWVDPKVTPEDAWSVAWGYFDTQETYELYSSEHAAMFLLIVREALQ